MLPEMTPAVDRALEAARSWAARLGQADIQPLHLLGGLLEEEEGRAASLLAAAGLDVAAWRRAMTPAARPDASLPLPLLALDAASRQALGEARELAGSLSSDRGISSECLLVPLLRADQTLRRSLEEHGLAVARLEAALAALAGPPLELDEPLQLAEPTERIDTARALDASANRAREALRVAEDYCRFCLDDALLSGELKCLRHDLTAALAELPGELLLEARETLRDVGTTLSTAAERERHSLRQVAHANLKRLQEALRSLEEFAKLFGGDTGARLEELRYRSYTLERAVLLGTTARERLAGCTVQVLLTGAWCSAALDWTLAEAAAGGATLVQLREKKLSDRDLLERVRNVRRWTRQAGVLFIVNDRPDIARLAEADGVHLGQDDLPVKEARRIVGPDLLIGVSTHNLEQVRRAVLDGASYLGIGPTFPSGTKEFSDLAGLEFVRQATAETSLPLFVIGGINARTLPAAVAAGARRIAVSQAVCQADDPRAAVAELIRLLRP
jgi:thiamine-phosphate pyrophosphorylase